MKILKNAGIFAVIAALIVILAVREKDLPDTGSFYTNDENVQIVVADNGECYAGIIGWTDNQDYTDRAVRLIDKNGRQVQQLELFRKNRDEYSSFFIGEKYVVACTNQLFGVDRGNRLFNVDIYTFDGNQVKSDAFISVARDDYIEDMFLRRANLQYHFEWMDSENLLMYGPLAIYRVNIPDGKVDKVVGIEDLSADWNCEKYMQTADSRQPGQDTFLYGIIPFQDGYSAQHGITFRLYDKMELNSCGYRVMQWKEGVCMPLTGYMTQNEIYYDSITGKVTTEATEETGRTGIALDEGHSVCLSQAAGGIYRLDFIQE